MLKNITKIDDGFTSIIYRANLEQPDKKSTVVAIKVSNAKGYSDGYVEHEITTLSALSHPNIVSVFNQKANFDHPHFVMEYAEHGALDNFLLAQNGRWKHDETLRTEIALGIACGLEYLHAKKLILHRDIKAGNILLGQNYSPKIADFGFAVQLAQRFDKYTDAMSGTYAWSPPEIVADRRLVTYTERSDVYSFALVIWMLYSLIEPYSDKIEALKDAGVNIKNSTDENVAILTMIRDGDTEDTNDIPVGPVRQLVVRSWSFTPSNRPRIEEFVSALNTMNGPSRT